MRIISTQIPKQFEKLKALLEDKVELINIPMIKVEPIKASEEILNQIKRVVNFNWLIFTSIRGVQCFFLLYDETGFERKKLNNLKFACIGESTNSELNKFGFNVNYINPGNTSKDFSKYLITDVLSNDDKVFLPLGNKANNHLPDKLAEYCKTMRVNVYETEWVEIVEPEVLKILKDGDYELMIFTSPSAIENFIKLTAFEPKINTLKIASIGATTSEAIRRKGFEPLLEASKPDLKILTNEILEYII